MGKDSSRTSHVSDAQPLANVIGGDTGGYYKTTITHEDGSHDSGCGKTSEQSQKAASSKADKR